jgi:hypothetical protein
MIPEPSPRTTARVCMICGTPIAECMGSVLPRDAVKLLEGSWDASFRPRELCNVRPGCHEAWKVMLAAETAC